MKLHLNIAGKPACGRQLSNHRDTRAQVQDTIVLASGFEQFAAALARTMTKTKGQQGCRFCGQATGLIPKPTRRQPISEDEDSYEAERVFNKEGGSDDE